MNADARWATYIGKVNHKLASIAVSLDLRGQAESLSKSRLLWIWVYLRLPKLNGLSDRSEFDALSAIEDKLAEALGDACGSLEAGRITSNGRREFYFYGESDGNFDASVSLVMSEFPQYTYEFGSSHDPGWALYLDVLYPTDEDFQKIANGDVLDLLTRQGDTLEAVRDVHHWIYFRSRAQRQQYALKAKDLGYSIERETEGAKDQASQFGLQITREQSVTPDQIDNAVIELFRLAKQLDGDYDGWEARVIKSQGE